MILALTLAPIGAAAQSGNTGGSLGKSGKSVSGGAKKPVASTRSKTTPGGTKRSVDLTGSWTWLAKCKLGSTPGTFTIVHAADNTFSGSLTRQTGSGTVKSGRLSGQQITFLSTGFPGDRTWTGQISKNGRYMSGSISMSWDKCTFTASR